MDEKEKRYTIGEISKITNLSKKMLMYYEEKKIVVPAMRNAENNYRYYTEKQLEELLLLKELRRVGFSLDKLSTIMLNRDLPLLRHELEVRIKEHNDFLLEAVNKLALYYEIYMRVLSANASLVESGLPADKAPPKQTESSLEPKFCRMPEQYMISFTFISRFNNRAIFMEKLAELMDKVEKYDLIATGSMFIIFHQNYQPSFTWEEGEVEICMPVEKAAPHCPFVRHMASNLFIVSTLRGSYTKLPEVYRQLESWAKEHSLELGGSSIEEYIIYPTMTSNPEDFVTKIYLPVAGSNLK